MITLVNTGNTSKSSNHNHNNFSHAAGTHGRGLDLKLRV